MYTNIYRNVFRKVFSSALTSKHLNIYYPNPPRKIKGAKGTKYYRATYFKSQHEVATHRHKESKAKDSPIFLSLLVSCVKL